MTPIPFKPVETGCDPYPADARALWQAARPPITEAQVCPYAFKLPAAPAQAAAAEGIQLDVDDLAAHGRALAQSGDFLLVEGAGGLLVPYAGSQTGADLAARLALPLLVVARTALGTINHTSLTLLEARRRNLPLAGYLLNRTTPDLAPHELEPSAPPSGRNLGGVNAAAIAELTGVRSLGVVPFVSPGQRNDPDHLAGVLAAALGERTLETLLASRSDG
jgi:dethiobiotin synthetase